LPDQAMPYLQKAVEVAPENFEAHAFLGDAYEQTGNELAAKGERARSESLKASSNR